MTGNMPAAEVDVDVDLVRRLLTSQHPDLAELPIELVTNGWDNVMFRLGDDLAVRVPRRASAVPLIEAEQQWLARFAPSLPVPVPAPVRSGVAGDGYPWPWSVVPWFEGRPFAPDPPDDLDRTARQLGEFVAALQRPLDGLPLNPFRGRPLVDLDASVRSRLPQISSTTDVDVDRLVVAWEAALGAPVWDGPQTLLHGDLHPLNVVVDDDGLVAVIDFGDLTGGDPATDYLAAWLFFDAPQRELFVDALGAGDAALDDATWERGRGAAISWCTAVVANTADHPVLHRIGLDGLARLLGDR